MEGANSWTLFRTMSFISSRAKAFKERFSHRQRSLSDSWMDQTSLDYTNIDDTCGAPAFEGGGSMLSLLDENAEWGPSIVVQRSKSLESMSTYHRPSIATIYSSAVPLQCTQSSVSIAVSPNSRRSSTIMQNVPLPKRKEQLAVPSCEYIPQFFSTPLLQSPAAADTETDLLMSPIPPVEKGFPPADVRLNRSQDLSRAAHSPGPSTIVSRSRPCVPKAILSTSCNQITDTEIPKIPGPPSTPKKIRPHSANSSDLGVFDTRKDSPSLLDLSNESIDSKPLIDMSSPPQRRKSRPLSCISFDPLMGQSPGLQGPPVPHTTSIPNLANEIFSCSPIPKLRAPPSQPRKTKLSATQSLNPFIRENDFFQFSNQSTSIPNLNVTCSTVSNMTTPFTLAVEEPPSTCPRDDSGKPVFAESDQAQDPVPTPRTPYKKKMSISSSSLMLNLHNRKAPTPFDPEQWRKYVEATFPSIQETGECSMKSRKLTSDAGTAGEKIKEKALPQVLKKQKHYSKLKHQSSMDESRHHRVDQPGGGGDANARLVEKRRTFLMRKQNNSAPDPVDDDEDVEVPRVTCHEKEVSSVNLCLGGRCRARGSDSSIVLPTIKLEPEVGIEHLDDLKYPDADPPCHFCSQQTSTSIHDENRLKIVSGGLVRKRDGSRDDSANHYMNLPSPMIHNENGDADPVFRSKYNGKGKDDMEQMHTDFLDELKEAQPPPSAFSRRRAIVTSKLTSSNLDDHKLSLSSSCNTPRNRRSSIVVIPPMQICPGDLLVYSKVLTNRQKTLDLESSAQCLHFDADDSRKGKNTWSLLKLFERSNRGKGGNIGGLDEVLGCIQRAEFEDEELSYYRGLSWYEFYTKVEDRRKGKERKYGAESGDGSEVASIESSISTESAAQSTSKIPDTLMFEVTAQVETSSAIELSKSPTRSDRSPLSDKPKKAEKSEKQENTVKKLHRKLVRAHSDRCFERSRLPSWKAKEKPLPIKPSPLVQTLSEKSLLVSPVSTASQGEYKRREAVWDLFQSECAFLFDHLMVLKDVFLEPLKRIQVEGFAMFAEPQLLFGNLDELCSVTHSFCKSFIKILLAKVGPEGELPTTEVLAQLFQKNEGADFLSQAYHCYALNYINALNYLETLRTYSEFCLFEKWCNKDARCKKLQLTDLLVAPVQHIMKVPLILKEVESRTENVNEKIVISQILEIEEKSIRELDDKMKWLKNFERLLEIQRNIFWPSVQELDPKIFVPDFLKPALQRQPCDRIIVSPRRQIIIEGQLQILDSGKAQEVFVVLFDDMLLITKRKKGLSKKKSTLSENWASSCRSSACSESSMRYVVYKQPLSLDRFFVYDISLPESLSCRLEFAFVLVVMNRFQQVVTIHSFQTTSDQIKQNWLSKLRETQDKWKKTLENTMFRPVSPQDSQNQNAAELSVCESMSSCAKGRSMGASTYDRSIPSVCSSSADLCSTMDRSTSVSGQCPTRHSSEEEEDESECSYPSLRLAAAATKHKKSF